MKSADLTRLVGALAIARDQSRKKRDRKRLDRLARDLALAGNVLIDEEVDAPPPPPSGLGVHVPPERTRPA